LSRDTAQKYIYLADGENDRVQILNRESIEVLTSFGEGGRQSGKSYGVHSIATDSRGNIYTTETWRGQCAQRFLYKGSLRRIKAWSGRNHQRTAPERKNACSRIAQPHGLSHRRSWPGLHFSRRAPGPLATANRPLISTPKSSGIPRPGAGSVASAVSDQQVRAVDIGKSSVDVGVAYRAKLTGQSSVAEHDLVSEVYHIMDSEATLVTGPEIVSMERRPSTNDNVRNLNGPGSNGTSIRAGVAYRLKPGDVIVIPAGVGHCSTRIDDHIRYLMIRIDPDKVTPLKDEAASKADLARQ
jgi:hypothetical protein